ncbi:UDP-N-acetylmuramate dehydrogenase [Paraperlucidibaca baekdonensis]|uniref:UDP-N-acetylenolpyruvoylglucosamine reductase n=1 Tax=Paraperlucidibaca baekdonensis TaxID=748120 RepID=A0A3E0H600_9GAMM|nr:UDP-N-acetylmuramate dehydrogenase [Paraperlucidibaca baekdonensis]REH38909.1 UDP-N-acetylmuramate dehydrogenase [Paraperlucidibaca baekdonensis]
MNPQHLRQHVQLQPYNTLGLMAVAEYFYALTNADDLPGLLAMAKTQGWPVQLLGGGSNIVFAGDVPGLTIQMNLRGIRECSADYAGDTVIIEAAAGEPWHAFTQTALANGWCGLENLSLIPGSVGAAPVQNIGAYGVEIADVMHSLRAYDREQGVFVELAASDCGFAYRDSLFKSAQPGRYVIVAVRFALSATRPLVLGYGDIASALSAAGVSSPTAHDVARAVIAIRQSKLPDPALLGNAGSFFKNPLLPAAQVAALQSDFPGLVAYAAQPQAPGLQKVAAGWLIEQAGWKGYRRGAVAVHERQALVLVHHGGGHGAELLALADDIVASVKARYGVQLEQEPVLMGQA